MTVLVLKNVHEVAERLLKDESLTRRERDCVEGLLDGTWRLTPDGSFVSSGKEKQSQPPATSSKPGLGARRTYREALSEMFERAQMKARTMDRLLNYGFIGREILNHILAFTFGVSIGTLLIVVVAAVLR